MVHIYKLLKIGSIAAILSIATPNRQVQAQLFDTIDSSALSANIHLQLEFIPHTSKFAGVYWLPDYVEEHNGYGYGDPINNTDYNPSEISCAKYGLLSKCEKNYKGSKIANVSSGLHCYKDCRCEDKFRYDSSNCKGIFEVSGETCEGKSVECKKIACEKRCDEFSKDKTCQKGQLKKTCDSDCGTWAKCEGEACPIGIGSCKIGCLRYSEQVDCFDVCLECKPEPPICAMPNIIKETFWCDGVFSCWQVPTDNVCQWCNQAWRCLMP